MTTAAAEGWDPDKEAADLGRLRAALSAQLEQVEQKMAALGGQASEQPRPHKSVSNLAKASIVSITFQYLYIPITFPPPTVGFALNISAYLLLFSRLREIDQSSCFCESRPRVAVMTPENLFRFGLQSADAIIR